MGQITSLMTSNELTSSASSSSKSQRRNSKKSRDSTKVQKAEDVPLYKGGCSVDELVEYIHNGRDPTAVTKNNVGDNNAVLTQRCAATVLTPTVTAERRDQPPPLPPPALPKHPVKKKITSKKDPTESDSGCGDCITADHQKDLLNSVDVQPLGCVAALGDDIATAVTPAVISLLDTVRCDIGALYEGSAADYDIETYTYDNLSSFVPSTEDEFMIVQRRRKGGGGGRTVTTTTCNDDATTMKSRRSLGGKSRLNGDDDDRKRTASKSSPINAAVHDDDGELPAADASATIDATFSSLESVSSYASANSSVRSISPLELYSSDTVHSTDHPVGGDYNFTSSSPRITYEFYPTTAGGTTDVLNPSVPEQVLDRELSSSADDVEISNDQRVFDSIRSTQTFSFFAADEKVLGVGDGGESSSVHCQIGNTNRAVNQLTSASILTSVHPPSTIVETVKSPVADADKRLRQTNALPYDCFQRVTTPWSGLDEFCTVESEYKLSPVSSSLQTTIWSYEFAFGSVDFAPYASRSCSILPLLSSSRQQRSKMMTQRSERRSCKRSVKSKLRAPSPLSSLSCTCPIRFSARVTKFPDDGVVVQFGFDCDALANVHVTTATTTTNLRAITKTTKLDDKPSNVTNLREVGVVNHPRAPTHRVFPERRAIRRTINSSLVMTDHQRNYYASHGSSLSCGDSVRTSVVQSEKIGFVGPSNTHDVRVVSSKRPSASLRQSVGGAHRVFERCMNAVRASTSHFDLLEAQSYFLTNYEITRKDVLLGRTDLFVYSSQSPDMIY